ncbi:MAG: hypothetical protein WCE21_01085, partial [Candidatus Babeliales bacterium]
MQYRIIIITMLCTVFATKSFTIEPQAHSSPANVTQLTAQLLAAHLQSIFEDKKMVHYNGLSHPDGPYFVLKSNLSTFRKRMEPFKQLIQSPDTPLLIKEKLAEVFINPVQQNSNAEILKKYNPEFFQMMHDIYNENYYFFLTPDYPEPYSARVLTKLFDEIRADSSDIDHCKVA